MTQKEKKTMPVKLAQELNSRQCADLVKALDEISDLNLLNYVLADIRRKRQLLIPEKRLAQAEKPAGSGGVCGADKPFGEGRKDIGSKSRSTGKECGSEGDLPEIQAAVR